jgi:class 3 adenylate cyclase/predicted ATPase
MWGAAMDVGGWLRGLGLGQYETIFRDNKIDADLLPRLTNDDLKDIGVSAFGDRRRLLDAIAALAGAKPPSDAAASPSKPALSKGPEVSAERRPITVMFCDLVGSTSLAARLDPEDWRNLVNAYLHDASKAVTGLGGHVLKKLGDGLMALFGYPHAQENDAERAVRAALAIQRALAEINARNRGKGAPDLLARIGIESGPVVVEATGEVFGDAPNVAARVQAAAEPGSVLVTLNVQRQVAGLFVAEEQGERELRGLSEPVQLFRIVRGSGGGRRGGARVLTPFVGREEELALLARRWDSVRSGEGQLALIVGEPGLGKSRLIEEFHARLGDTPHTWVEWSASQLLQNTPLHPIAEWGRLRFGLDAPADQRLADLEGTLRLIGLDPAEHATLIAPLVDIPLPPGRTATLAPEELRRRQLAAMTAWVLAGARSQPAVVTVEDLHWADPTSLDLLRGLAERGAQAPLLLLATARPEFRPPWSLRSHHSIVSLRPLDRAGVAQMVGEISSRHALSKEVVEGVSERTGGVPLFVEEVTRLLLERGEQGGVQAIPPTLQQSLAARLDRLGPAREVAQIGAVLGREFGYPLLRDVAELDEPPLQASLDRLGDADLLFVEGAPPQASYRFKHALIQDAAYDSLLKSRRQALHRRAAGVLREDPERSMAEPEVIAHHFTQAGMEDTAIEWWGKAGDQALRRSAFQEAIAHLGKAIEMADKSAGASQPRAAASTAAADQRLKLQTSLGQAMMYSHGFGSDESKTAFARARTLATGVGDAGERFDAYFGLLVGSVLRGELSLARETAESFLRDAENEGRMTEAAVARRNVGAVRFYQGDLIGGRSNLGEALRIYDPQRDRDAKFRFGVDTCAAATGFLALVGWALGDVERARTLSEDALARADETAHAPTRAFVYRTIALYQMLRGDPQAARRIATIVVDLGREHGMALWLTAGEMDSNWARAWLSDRESGMTGLREALAAYLAQGNKLFVPLFQGWLAELEAEGQYAHGPLRRIDEALALASETGERWADALLHRIRGAILLKRDPTNPAPAEEALLAAIAIAQAQKARSFELQAALALAKLYQSTNQPVEAHAVLAPALEGFSPTPEMPELAEAQELLAALAETEEVKAAEAQRQRRAHLQTAYGQAMMWAKGFSAEETRAAFSRATELTAKTDSFADRFAAAHFQWTLAYLRGELRSARELELSFLKQAEVTGRIVEAGVARRGLALACYQSADFLEARTHCERALEACDPKCDRETQERFHDATGSLVMSVLAVTMWQLGEVERARELIDQANRRGRELGHGPSMAHPIYWKSHLEILRGDPAAALIAAEALEELGREHGMLLWRVAAELGAGWARGRLHDAAGGSEDLRRAQTDRVHQDARFDTWFFTGLLAELEAETLGAESALARIDEAMALARQVETRCNLSFLHLLRGKLLLERDPSNPAAAEEAFQTAFEIAKQQGARSWGLRAALSLAKLYQSTARHVDAHVVLAPALEGFSPTPEMREIAEAQALLATFAETTEVKAAIAQRQRRLDLQTSYGQALQLGKGFAAEETRAAFARVAEFARPSENPAARFAAFYAQCLGSVFRGEFVLAQEIAQTFLREAEADGRATEAGIARRLLGIVLFYQGDLRAARSFFERALADFVPERDGGDTRRLDGQASAEAILASLVWQLGEVERARLLIQQAVRRARELGHAATIVHVLQWNAFLEIRCGEARGRAPRRRRIDQIGGRAWHQPIR